jgi:outer membrane receptor protein involved in Fe transport
MPKHTFKAGVNQNFLTNFNSGLNMIYSSGVYLRGDESNQLKTTNSYIVFNATSSWKPLDNFEMFARINNILNSKYETMGVLGEASASEVNVPISELGDTGSGTAVGALDPRFLSPGSPLGLYFGVKISW